MKNTNRILMLMAAFLIAIVLPVNYASAKENEDWIVLDEKTYIEDGAEVTEVIEFLPDTSGTGEVLFRLDAQKTLLGASSGSGTFRNTKTYTWNKGTPQENVGTYFAEGYFVWGNGSVSVSNPKGGITGLSPYQTIKSSNLTSGTGQYGGLFNKYAYVTLDMCVTTVIQDHNFTVTIRVSENGNQI